MFDKRKIASKIMHYKTVNWRKLAVSISWLEFNFKIVRVNNDGNLKERERERKKMYNTGLFLSHSQLTN